MTNQEIIKAVQGRVERHLTPERAMSYLATAETVLKSNPTTDRQSIGKALLACAELNLMPNTATGEAYIIPYNDKNTGKKNASLVIAVRGWQSLAYRSGLVKSLTAEVVFPSDTFKLELGDRPRLKHTPDLEIDRSATKPDLSNILGAYAVAKMSDGTSSFRFLTVKEIQKLKRTSKSNKFWLDWPEQMVKKTAMKQLIKYLPIATDEHIGQARQIDEIEIDEPVATPETNLMPSNQEVTVDEVNALLSQNEN